MNSTKEQLIDEWDQSFLEEKPSFEDWLIAKLNAQYDLTKTWYESDSEARNELKKQMFLRDQFAMEVMKCQLNMDGYQPADHAAIASESYKQADEMIKARRR